MCLGDDFDLESPERRTFLSKTTAAAAAAFATLTFLREATGSTQQQEAQTPPTRVLDAPNLQHGRVTF